MDFGQTGDQPTFLPQRAYWCCVWKMRGGGGNMENTRNYVIKIFLLEQLSIGCVRHFLITQSLIFIWKWGSVHDYVRTYGTSHFMIREALCWDGCLPSIYRMRDEFQLFSLLLLPFLIHPLPPVPFFDPMLILTVFNECQHLERANTVHSSLWNHLHFLVI